MAGQFDFQQSSSPLLAALTQVPQERQKMQLLQEQARQARFNNFLNTLTTGASLARSIQQIQAGNMENQNTRNQMEGQKTLGNILTEPMQASPVSRFQFGPSQTQGPVVQPIAQTPLSFGQTMQGQTQPQRIEAALLQANPAESTKQMAEKLYSEKLLKGVSGDLKTQNYLVDGVPRSTFTNKTGDIFDASTRKILNGHKIEPYVPPSPYANTRLELGAQQNLTGMVNSIKNELTTSPNAKVVVAADNFVNQVNRVLKGEVVADKTTMTALMSELDRALSNGMSSEKRMEGLIPSTFKGTFADLKSKIVNEPTSRDAQAFLNNLRVEAIAAGNQRRAAVEQIIKPILGQARLAQKQDPEGFRITVESLGLDANEAKKGRIKFKPGSSSLFYGEGYDQVGSPTQTLSPEEEAASYLGGQ